MSSLELTMHMHNDRVYFIYDMNMMTCILSANANSQIHYYCDFRIRLIKSKRTT